MNDEQLATHLILRPGAEVPEIEYDGPPTYPALVELLGGYPVQTAPLLNGRVELNLYDGDGVLQLPNPLAERLLPDGRNPRGVAVITPRVNDTAMDPDTLAQLLGLLTP